MTTSDAPRPVLLDDGDCGCSACWSGTDGRHARRRPGQPFTQPLDDRPTRAEIMREEERW